MQKSNIFSHVVIATGLIVVAIITLLFHSYTYAEVNIFNAPGELIWAVGDVVGNWRDYEWTMYLGVTRILVGVGGGITLFGLLLHFSFRNNSLKSREAIAAILIFLALGATVGFLTIFYPCYEMMAPAMLRPMRCIWTMRVLFGVNAIISTLGFFMLLHSPSKEFCKGINIALVLSVCLFLLVPQTLTGVCLAHRCVNMFRPFARVVGGLMLTVSIINTFLLKRVERKYDESYEM